MMAKQITLALPLPPTYDYRDISPDGQGWIRDLMAHADETGFPELAPEKMSASDRDRLVEYLDADDDSLSEEDMEFSRRVAEEVRGLLGSPDQGSQLG